MLVEATVVGETVVVDSSPDVTLVVANPTLAVVKPVVLVIWFLSLV